MKKYGFIFPLSVQITLPGNFRENRKFIRDLEVIKSLGLWGVELNIADLSDVRPDDIKSFLSGFHLKWGMFASGLFAKTHSLSLSSSREENRKASVQKLKEIIDFVHDPDIGIIVGFLKGPCSGDAEKAGSQFALSVREIAPYAAQRRVPILIEATNHKESSVANSLDDAFQIIKSESSPCLRILPDTFHMNIEEKDMLDALTRYSDAFSSIHFSDSNRLFPGLGDLDFGEIVGCLKKNNYTGRIAIEGNVRTDFASDLKQSVAYLKPMIS